MFCVELYLWHLKWTKQVFLAQEANLELPKLSDIPRPSLLGEIDEFK